MLRGLASAIRLLTVLPLPNPPGGGFWARLLASGEHFDAGWALPFFPVVGGIVGLIAAESAATRGVDQLGPTPDISPAAGKPVAATPATGGPADTPAAAPRKPSALPAEMLVTQPGLPGPFAQARAMPQGQAIPQRPPSFPELPQVAVSSGVQPPISAPQFEEPHLPASDTVTAEPAALWRRMGVSQPGQCCTPSRANSSRR